MARTMEWKESQSSGNTVAEVRAIARLEQFLTDHNLAWTDLHALLVAYFKREQLYNEVRGSVSWVPPELPFPAATVPVCPHLG